jgi:60 kDa SS-A/Ro ribonucleoprotein
VTKYAQHVSMKVTPQSEAASPLQRVNSAGGYAFTIDKWARLERFLILGADGGTYYATERKLTQENAACVRACLDEDGPRTVATIAAVSEAGRAPKNDPAIFALALAASHSDVLTRSLAMAALPRVARIGTHLFQFVDSVQHLRGWGHALKRGVARWYEAKSADDVAYQMVKYQGRHGFTHRDLLRLSKPKKAEGGHLASYRWATKGELAEGAPRILEGWEKAKAETNPKTIAALITEYRLTHEMIPTEAKNSAEVWAALLPHMPMTAMVRNLAKMTAVGLLRPLSDASRIVSERLGDRAAIKKARVHPIAMLSALKVYSQGHGEKGKLSWSPVSTIRDALDEAFYLAFDAIEPTGKRMLLAIDVSGSMDGGSIAGVPGMTPRMVAAAMAMVTARVEKQWHIVGFTAAGGGYGGRWGGGSPGLTPIDIGPKMRLDDVITKMARLPMGGTDCALPMLHAAQKGLTVDGFAVYTDNETWAGAVHPHQALEQYRKKSGIAAKLAVVGCTATVFTIANANDVGMMDLVGFDTAAPAVMADFFRA